MEIAEIKQRLTLATVLNYYRVMYQMCCWEFFK